MIEKRKTVRVTVNTFQRWLNAQPPRRKFQYFDCTGCMFATYLREHHRVMVPNCTGFQFSIHGEVREGSPRIPKPIEDAIVQAHMYDHNGLTVGNVKRRLA